MTSTLTTTPHLHQCLLLLLVALSQVCSSNKPCRVQGRHHECMSAPFVPGYSLAGEGFDVSTLRRKGAHVIDVRTYLNRDATCTLYCNPLQNFELQKVPLSTVEWRSRSLKHCDLNLHGSSHNSVSSVVQAFTAHESDDWRLDLDMEGVSDLEVGGSLSEVAEFAAARSREDRFTFSIHRLRCSQYRYWILYHSRVVCCLALGFASCHNPETVVNQPTTHTLSCYRVSNNPPLSAEFQNDMVALPRVFNSSTNAQYRRFVDTYGTHYIRQIYLGGQYRRVTAIRTCLSTLNGFSSFQVESCLGLGLTDGLGKLAYPLSMRACSKILSNQDVCTRYSGGLYRNFTELTGGLGWTGALSLERSDAAGYHRWLRTIKDHPAVVKYSLRPVHLLVRDAPRRTGVKATVQQYLKERGISPRSGSLPSCDREDPNLASNCCPRKAWRGTLEVTIVRAYRLNGDRFSPTDAYVKLWYSSIHRKTAVVESDNPRWDAHYNLGKVDTHLSLKVEVWDDDVVKDDLLGSCMKNLREGTHIHKCSTTSGGLEFIIKLTCDNYLTGTRCDQYKPSPK